MNKEKCQTKYVKSARKLDIKKIGELAEKLKRAEIKEKEWLREQEMKTQQVF